MDVEAHCYVTKWKWGVVPVKIVLQWAFLGHTTSTWAHVRQVATCKGIRGEKKEELMQ